MRERPRAAGGHRFFSRDFKKELTQWIAFLTERLFRAVVDPKGELVVREAELRSGEHADGVLGLVSKEEHQVTTLVPAGT
jgi:hypothetical protein